MIVVTAANKAPSQDYYCWDAFNKSLARYNCEPVVLGWEQEWKGLMTKPNLYFEWLRGHNLPDEPIVICDAWDIVFAADPNEIYAEFLDVAGHSEILWNAEKTKFPPSELHFPETGTSYRYLNSGFAVGYPMAFQRMFEWMKLDTIGFDRQDGDRKIEPNDQLYFQKAYVESRIPMALDAKAEICQTLHGVEESELDFSGDRIRNVETGSYPICFHMNGHKERHRDKILAKLCL